MGGKTHGDPSKGPGMLMSEDSVVLEGGLGVKERQGLQGWRVQGLSRGGCTVPPLGC